jgi:hypothetical protein
MMITLITRLGGLSSSMSRRNPLINTVVFDRLTKVNAEFDAGDVNKNPVCAEGADEIMVKAARLAFSVLPTVADKDAAH